MPVSIVVGGQFGSEGKGKVALEIARRAPEPVSLVRVGGPNSGHTAYDRDGRKFVLRQLPAGCIDRDVDVVLPVGSYIDIDVLKSEIERLRYPLDRIRISSHAQIITDRHKQWEAAGGLGATIGSTGSGVGAAVMALTARGAANFVCRATRRSIIRFLSVSCAIPRSTFGVGWKRVGESSLKARKDSVSPCWAVATGRRRPRGVPPRRERWRSPGSAHLTWTT